MLLLKFDILKRCFKTHIQTIPKIKTDVNINNSTHKHREQNAPFPRMWCD
ncbi:hypothetical protein Hanom_Chr09g00769541 [Helianthus anomalus]